ncbi:hypothetical protein [Amycolatopsis sp. NBC_01480]|uniref:hypothetical protein n=1 Tax=Amycolatopsis sp. NBC_01480 TaxID=2903562 RepID=UPI002E2C44A4|nr:hypothetical protein [Amycolatopsis sp. NBC_01480]
MTSPVGAPPGKPAYPEDNDKTIRDWAGLPLIGDQNAIDTLNLIKNQLFGDADKVWALGKTWSAYTTLGSEIYTIQEATNNLASDWTGDAKTQFDTFNGNVLTVLGKDQGVMTQMGVALATCAGQVYTTYANAINDMKDCANALVKAAAGAGLSWIPVVGEVLDVAVVDELWNALNSFVTGVETLISQSIAQYGQYKQSAMSFIGQADLFSAIAAPGSKMGSSEFWTPTSPIPGKG